MVGGSACVGAGSVPGFLAGEVDVVAVVGFDVVGTAVLVDGLSWFDFIDALNLSQSFFTPFDCFGADVGLSSIAMLALVVLTDVNQVGDAFLSLIHESSSV